MKVIFVVNSFVNKVGNVGYRIGKIIDKAHMSGSDVTVVARGSENINSDIKRHTPGVLGNIPRLIKAIQIHLFKGLNYRYIDIKIFEFYFLFVFYILMKEQRKYKGKKIAHLVEPSPVILKHLKKYNFIVILDLAIAPSSYVKCLKEKGQGNGFFYNEKIDKYERACIKLSSYIATPSQFVFEEVNKIGTDAHLFIEPFGVDRKEVVVNRLDNCKVKFCFAGVINHRKGVDILLEAWGDPEFNDSELHLCGKITPEIQTILNEKKFSNIYLPGFVDIQSYMAKCDIYVFPSILEGSSKSTYEAMAMSLPVITTFESGSLVEHFKSGLIVEKIDVDSLKNAMLLLKRDKVLRENLSKNALEIVRKFTWDDYAKRYLELYKEVI
ncbi:glycosyltransferase family 4 protein [Vibrio parahaemolyticus]|uniref:N, N'-diacetylbacillosaminyl-diphospho-undecaprenol alpha-1,3-N-acetylgalactosaminyltransferase n=1 Tax=Vibrio parahaemolyticus TaxID=670 RepID=A0A7M1VV17_VIBPH|nr:glycosyltransferase family 4 protein [Vibrio parahaemolyticus]EJB8583599.1 glycosyltransferase family 4 protein [Vibrio parahaemolyticus]QOS19058.1 N,N'-diacetylbacillosaminyl-diphospho-undecaprenol alpha-1,3-N-acetylgalactosaminyltransferase [Vibrio parahaemolyticus]